MFIVILYITRASPPQLQRLVQAVIGKALSHPQSLEDVNTSW